MNTNDNKAQERQFGIAIGSILKKYHLDPMDDTMIHNFKVDLSKKLGLKGVEVTFGDEMKSITVAGTTDGVQLRYEMKW